MNSASKGKKHKWIKAVAKSFSYAAEGLVSAAKTERNLKIHLAVMPLITVSGFIFSISKAEWLVVIIVIGGMIALELMNTAVERVVDLVTDQYHPLAKQAKDIAAAAVLVYAITAIVIGVIIFLPKIIVSMGL
ncbi:MAG: diacylglycerol kinase family protein [Cytobacillus gottheilii]|uniref:diacylglycerol kinase family protein n=1 Tax=Cytobacillus gottheilii TaxID=859144 RepID=UPI0008328BAB|nr:diacylglycerol kinase family protein [Cytobacillus gottheilii]